MNNLVLNQHTIPYIHVARTVPIHKNFIYMAFCINMVYFTPMVPILYLPNHRLYDGGIKLLNLFFDMFEKWQILVGKQQNFPKCRGFECQCTKQKEKY